MSIEKCASTEFRLSSLKLLRCLKLSTVEVLYDGLIQYSAFTGSHFSFDMGIDFLSNFFLQVKETGDPAEQQNQSQSW